MDDRNLELLQAIQAMIDPLKIDMQEVKGDIKDLKKEVRKINITIETEIRKNIQILAEGHQTLKERLWHLPDKVDNIEEAVEILKFTQSEMAKDVYSK